MSDRAKLFSLWNWLPAFHVVAQTQHLPTASRRLHVSVPALSRTIKQLESALGFVLFERTRRGLSLNPRGRALQAVVERAVSAFDGELETADSASTPGPPMLATRAELPSRWQMGDVLLMHAEYDAALAAWRPADTVPRLETGERAEWGLRRLRVAILRRCWNDAASLSGAQATRGWSPEARAEAAAWSALAECMRGRLRHGENRLVAAVGLLADCDSGAAHRAWVVAYRAEGNLHVAAGRPHDAIRAYEAGEGLCMALGDRWERSIALYNLGEAHLIQGSLDRAALLFDRANVTKLEIGDRWGRIWVHHGRAFLHLKRGQAAEAVREASVGLTLAVEIPDPQPLAMLYVLIGRAQLAIGDVQQAERAFRLADRAAERARSPAERVQAHIGLLDAWLRLGEIAEAANVSKRLGPLARACGSPHADAAALVARAAFETHRGRTAPAQQLLTEAARALPDPFAPYGYWFNVTQ